MKITDCNVPDELLLHAPDPSEGRSQEWTLHIRSGMGETLETTMKEHWVSYCLFRNAGYNHRWFLEVPCQESNHNEFRKAFKKAMTEGKVNVESISHYLRKKF